MVLGYHCQDHSVLENDELWHCHLLFRPSWRRQHWQKKKKKRWLSILISVLIYCRSIKLANTSALVINCFYRLLLPWQLPGHRGELSRKCLSSGSYLRLRLQLGHPVHFCPCSPLRLRWLLLLRLHCTANMSKCESVKVCDLLVIYA